MPGTCEVPGTCEAHALCAPPSPGDHRLLGGLGQHLGALLAQHHQMLDAHTAPARVVEPWLDPEHHPRLQDHLVGPGAQERGFVDRQTHAVSERGLAYQPKEVMGIPFTFNVEILFDSDGNVTHVFADGVTEKIPLPDGSLFISAGRLDFVAHPGAACILSPDKGNPGNVAGFCAALS